MTDRPWYIGVLLGTAGWFAGIFALIFVFMLFKPDSTGSALVIGIVLLGAAWGLFMADREGAFVSQLALALSIAGQFATLFGLHEVLFKSHENIAGLAAMALVLQLTLVAAMPSRLHRVMSTLFACIAWAIAVRFALWDETFHPGGRGVPPSLASALLGFAIVWIPVGAALFMAIRTRPTWMAAGREDLVAPVAVGLVAGLAVGTLVSYPLDAFTWGTPGHGRGGWLALWPLLSALTALGALAGAFALGKRGLMGVCVVAALLHASHFYYAMGTTLLVKSMTMIVLGAALLAGARYLERRAPR
ncbi:MAG: DUF4401 domain-containing protein [Usitatibacter sp.]